VAAQRGRVGQGLIRPADVWLGRTSGFPLEQGVRPRHSQRRVDEDLKARLEQGPGAWKLLDTPADLLVALRDRGGGLFADLKGALRPDRTVLAGDLGDIQPSDLLNFLHQGRRTGVLFARSDGVERAIVFLEGNIAWASSTSPAEGLGELVSRMGLGDGSRIRAELGQQGDRRYRAVAELLVERGILTADEMRRGLHHQVVEIFLGLLVARSGSFIFVRGVDRRALPAALSLDTQVMLLDGLRRLDEMERYRTLVPNLDVTPRPTGKKLDGQVTAEARRVLALTDGIRTVAQLALSTTLGEFEATKAVYALIERGYLRL
jgi:hypothetical protein